MLVCSRCSGAYLGAVLGVVIPWIPTNRRCQQLIVIACTLTLIQLLSQFMLGIDHTQRLYTGAILGFSVALLAKSVQLSKNRSHSYQFQF